MGNWEWEVNFERSNPIEHPLNRETSHSCLSLEGKRNFKRSVPIESLPD